MPKNLTMLSHCLKLCLERNIFKLFRNCLLEKTIYHLQNKTLKNFKFREGKDILENNILELLFQKKKYILQDKFF